MTASDYAVKYPYGLTSGYWSPTNPHRGNDRPTPLRTPLVIGNTTIGLTGVTGEADGAHLHTQAGTDLACQKTFDPTPLEFKPGKVVALRTVDKNAWGKYITLQVGDKFITYAHLDEVHVSLGQVIEGGYMGFDYNSVPSREEKANHYRARMGREATEAELADKSVWGRIHDDNSNELRKQRDAALAQGQFIPVTKQLFEKG